MKNFVAYVRSVLAKRVFMTVLAEEPNPTNPEPTNPEPPAATPPKEEPKPAGTVNFEDLVKKAREEEKAKLYPQLEKLKGEKNNLLLVVSERDNEIADLKKQVAKLTTDYSKATKDLEDGTKTNKTVSELTATIAGLERQLEEAQIKYETDITSLKVDSFREKQIALAGGEIIPELVTGTTEEEITASIEQAKQRYAEITNKALQGVQMPSVNPASSAISLQEKSVDEIANMKPQDWAEYRKSLGIK